MLTDWVLVRRLAHELRERVRGARVVDAGSIEDGRIAVAIRTRSGPTVIAIDLFGSPPVVTLEERELAITVEPGFVRKLATALRATSVLDVRARRGDRLLRLTFGSRSRFGVADAVDLFVELVPKFGNAVLVKGETIVSAAKEFSPAAHPSRPVMPGLRYEMPPLPPGALPRLLVESGEDPAVLERTLESEGVLEDPLFVYRDGTRLVQAYVVPLPQFAGLQGSREPTLLAVFDELREMQRSQRAHGGVERQRQALLRRLASRSSQLRGELQKLAKKREDAEAAGKLRAQGEALLASLHELPAQERPEAKDRAAALFARYKKLRGSVAHVEARQEFVERTIENLDSLAWEAQRAGPEDLGDVESAVAQLEPHRAAPAARTAVRKRKRVPLEFRTRRGSRIVVGRSPVENADVTFRIARPDDLWFHAQGIPGAHVILARDDRTPPPPEDIEMAAGLAAFHSKGRGSGKVAVDYTLRKYVRKQQNAPPGLVWYTHPTTVLAQPESGTAD